MKPLSGAGEIYPTPKPPWYCVKSSEHEHQNKRNRLHLCTDCDLPCGSNAALLRHRKTRHHRQWIDSEILRGDQKQLMNHVLMPSRKPRKKELSGSSLAADVQWVAPSEGIVRRWPVITTTISRTVFSNCSCFLCATASAHSFLPHYYLLPSALAGSSDLLHTGNRGDDDGIMQQDVMHDEMYNPTA